MMNALKTFTYEEAKERYPMVVESLIQECHLTSECDEFDPEECHFFLTHAIQVDPAIRGRNIDGLEKISQSEDKKKEKIEVQAKNEWIQEKVQERLDQTDVILAMNPNGNKNRMVVSETLEQPPEWYREDVWDTFEERYERSK